MKKYLMMLLCALMLLAGCAKADTTEEQFKEYDVPGGEIKTIELMNVAVDMTAYQGFTDRDHVFRRTTMKESFRLLDEEASGILYFGYSTCPYCLQVVPVLNELAKKYGQTVYYIDVYNEVDRISDAELDRYMSAYADFLETDEDGEPVFYVPQVFVIVNGQVIDGHVGAVDSFDPSTQSSLTSEQSKELIYILESMIRTLGEKE